MKYTSSVLKPELVAVGKLALLGCTVALFSACGGGGGSSTPVVPAPVAVIDPLAPVEPVDFALAQASLSVANEGMGGDGGGDGGAGGAAGDGAPLRRAVIVLTDVAGKTLTGQTDDAGNYLIRYKTAEIKPPFVMKVIDAGGNVLAAPSEATIPVGKVVRININPLTDKITSDILPASVAGTDKQFNGASLNLAALPKAKADMVASIRAALSTAGITNTTAFDPVTSKYAYDGTGVDAVIESISLTRNPGSGATQLQAKLAGLATAADGTVSPTLISASTPLVSTQVAIASSPALTFGKLKAWIDFVNGCLARPASVTADCDPSDPNDRKLVAANYKQNGRDFEEDFVRLISEADRSGVRGSVIRNPSILFTSRYPGSTTDDAAVVEVTVRQPRTGPLAGNIATPIEYVQTLVFKRDDVTPGLRAGNWILQGNQASFNWEVQPRYTTLLQQNAPRNADDGQGLASRTTSSLRLNFDRRVFNPATRSYGPQNVYAVRLKGPGLPAAGLVFAPTTANASGDLGVLNKTGAIPAQGVTTPIGQNDFRFAQALVASGAPRSTATWPGNQPYYADTPSNTDFSTLQAFSVYTAEIYVNGSTTPIIETRRILTGIERPGNYTQRPLHDLSPSLALIRPPLASSTTNLVSWVRNPLGINITSASYGFELLNDGRSGFFNFANLPDAMSINPSSTSIAVIAAPNPVPAFTTTFGTGAREVGLSGTAARASFFQSIYWSN